MLVCIRMVATLIVASRTFVASVLGLVVYRRRSSVVLVLIVVPYIRGVVLGKVHFPAQIRAFHLVVGKARLV